MLTFPLPNPFNGSSLAEALGVTPLDLFVKGDELGVNLPESERDRVAAAVAAHTGEPTAEEQADRDERDQLDALRAKARAVWRGEDTFTVAQVQKILAGLVLRATK